MQLDELGLFSDDQAVTVTAASTNVVDLKPASVKTSNDAPSGINSGPGEGTPINVLCQVSNADFAGGTSIQASIQMDTTDAFSSATTVASGPVVAVADAVAGKNLLPQNLPYEITERYVRILYTVVGTMSAGNVTAGIAAALQTNK